MSELIDNRRKRIESLKQIIRRLHQGADPESVRQQMLDIVGASDACEVAAMEQEIIAEGVPVREVQSMCDLHARVVRDLLPPRPVVAPPGHPIDTIQRENAALADACDRMQAAMDEVRGHHAALSDPLLRWRQALNDLMDVDKHYRRKEDLFFSVLERHGITGPSKVMWGVHDEARARIRRLDEALRSAVVADADTLSAIANQAGEPVLEIVRNLIAKEEQILLPMMQQTLTEEEWAEIWTQSPCYGWCLVEPRDGYRPPQSQAREAVELPRGRAISFPTGQLDFDQLRGVFAALPVDLTFVDAEDRVRFFSGGERIFTRSKAILGRKVQHCHPPKSVHIVDQIVADFRSGRQNVAEFWIELHGKFIHIRYFAVRDDTGAYLGTLEVTQDLTALRALQGERRLLQYDAPSVRPAEAAAAP